MNSNGMCDCLAINKKPLLLKRGATKVQGLFAEVLSSYESCTESFSTWLPPGNYYSDKCRKSFGIKKRVDHSTLRLFAFTVTSPAKGFKCDAYVAGDRLELSIASL